MNGNAAIVEVLKREGVEYLFCFPANTLIDACAAGGIRPILTRTERTLLNMADGYSRVSNGARIGVCAVQDGPGVENAFAGVAQAFADSSPILFLPGQSALPRWGIRPDFDVEQNYRGVTKWVARANAPDRLPDLLRRAFARLRSGRPGPVMLGIPRDVATGDLSDGAFDYTPPRRVRSSADPQDIAEAVRALLSAKVPILHVGQGVHYANAYDELREFAELVGAPVLTTLTGKSAFPENHPLSAGTAAYTVSGPARHFLDKSDLVFGVGCSFSKSIMSAPIPPGKVLIQVTIDEFDLHSEYPIQHAILGDAKLVLRQLIDEVRRQARSGPVHPGLAAEIKSVKDAWLKAWMPKLTSDEVPFNPYRVVWDLMRTLDRTRTILTHDSGNPRDQIVPFYESLVPRGYIGWGKSTQLGYSLGLSMGAKLAAPDRTVVNVMGDAAIGMSGMDIETAVRERIPILTVILNNGAMGGYEKHLPVATERYRSKYLSGHYAKVAEALGAYSERVEKTEEIVPAIRRGIEATGAGRPALIEMITREEQAFSK
ncbi:MAG: hypothetical protein A3F84_09035 [Candidatus Handelsmanbacteria bacterium RIFCSPLOWO2_12_FULL_64_10]|uniref:Thiamine pyrophosphate-requiring protein n=1 Tax=Handelsmanbacteria sp. (strain RIFCSPLOWO2_12_FULL_64_10) TaxID=1817868 RepID=A0A1F6CYY6_HANXR|nr:MAG: hypothetical protein A3F84_09035 [Candidatus Handelsmanbacteria bacterium RIFCSPLOWO2_12_FULL_64_10]